MASVWKCAAHKNLQENTTLLVQLKFNFHILKKKYFYNEDIAKFVCFGKHSILSTKNSQNSDKTLRFLKISSDFQNVFLSKYSDKLFQKSVQPAAPKYFVWEFLRFSKKFVGSKFSDFCQNFFFRIQIFVED